MSKLYVTSLSQKIIFDHEMKGQMSDGHWENANPFNHWEPWCNAEVVVSDKPGRDFKAIKDNYNFTHSGLLKVVGDRIILKVRASMLGFDPKIIDDIPDSLAQYNDYWEYVKDDKSGYWTALLEKLNNYGINAAIMQALEEWNGYTRRDLIQDCNLLKIACQTKLD